MILYISKNLGVVLSTIDRMTASKFVKIVDLSSFILAHPVVFLTAGSGGPLGQLYEDLPERLLIGFSPSVVYVGKKPRLRTAG